MTKKSVNRLFIDLFRKNWLGICISLLVLLYIPYLFQFTLSDTFSTFSNDAGSYLLLAEKWSPYTTPTAAVEYSWPIQAFPPAFPWLLSIMGISDSLILGHLFVSFQLLLALVVYSLWIRNSESPWLVILFVLTVCVLPGTIISSMGILSENLYLLLSLLVLLSHSHLFKKSELNSALLILHFLLLSAALLTRSIGISLVIACIASSFLNKQPRNSIRVGVVAASVSALLAKLIFSYIDPQESQPGYMDITSVSQVSSTSELASFLNNLFTTIKTNAIQFPLSFNEYLSLGNPSIWFFSLSVVVLLFATLGLITRLRAAKVDAIYLFGYVGIILLWPYPEEMVRFIHPIVPILIFQIGFVPWRSFHAKPEIVKFLRPFFLLVLIASSATIQMDMFLKHRELSRDKRDLSGSYEAYRYLYDEKGTDLGSAYFGVMDLMRQSADVVKSHEIVASVKHDNLAVLADRKTVNLIARDNFDHSLCHLAETKTDKVFLSGITSWSNPHGHLVSSFLEAFTRNQVTLSSKVYGVEAVIFSLDKEKLRDQISRSAVNCQEYAAWWSAR